MISRHLVFLLALLILSTLAVSAQQPAKRAVNFGAFFRELSQVKTEGTQSQIALWLPYEFFWESAIAERPQQQAEIEKEMAFLKDYHTFVMSCQFNGPEGKFVQGGEAIRARAAIKLANGTEVSPLKEMPENVEKTVTSMRVLMAQAAGSSAENFQILLFPAKTKDGQVIVNIQKHDTLSLVMKSDKYFQETSFMWRTPFDALSPPVSCPKCHEMLSVKWYFCPWCGQTMTK